ncbi:transcription factor Ken 2-like [Uranotaenia lowii]|uniref:transcription factor Ken 2-like n=1 Tax=Uranotaenia lowii TaxID=190385 RepID=UPI0024789F68|nr:transcription factor Ken 2-like [Uranotaenia lowii]
MLGVRMLMLHYSKHGECILQEIGAAFRGEHATDLLLICDGKETVRAHKLVLAAASPLIRMILEETPVLEGITTVHFPDVQVAYFRLLLDFLYSGQVYVRSVEEYHHLQDLLALLQIKASIWKNSEQDAVQDGGKRSPSLPSPEMCLHPPPKGSRRRRKEKRQTQRDVTLFALRPSSFGFFCSAPSWIKLDRVEHDDHGDGCKTSPSPPSILTTVNIFFSTSPLLSTRLSISLFRHHRWRRRNENTRQTQRNESESEQVVVGFSLSFYYFLEGAHFSPVDRLSPISLIHTHAGSPFTIKAKYGQKL